ncbi:hypothetical protein QCBJ_05915 [Pseudomonas sp. QC2]|nr:hypothetical protein QCBJ_05915 [Pseudomonas sp. QC2]
MRLCAKVMFEYMQRTKSTNEIDYLDIHICHRGKCGLYCGRVLMQSPIKPTRGDAMSNSTKARKPDSTVDAWAILFLIILVVGTAVFWVSHQ